MLEGVYMEEVLRLSQELDEELLRYMEDNNISTLNEIEVKRERLNIALGKKLKQWEIDQLIREGITK